MGLAKKISITIVGGTAVLTGIAMLVLPGPGIVTILAGLALLGTEYHWARRLLSWLKRRLSHWWARYKTKEKGR